jgi:hypothetical protein
LASTDHHTFHTERGDVLASVQLILAREEERAGLRARAPAPVKEAPAPSPPLAEVIARVKPPSPVVPVEPPQPLAPIEAPRQAPPLEAADVDLGEYLGATPATWAIGMVDEPTGIRTAPALRRDLVLEQAWPSPGGGAVVVTLTFLLRGGPVPTDRRGVDRILTVAAEAAGSAARAPKGVYRTSAAELAVVVRGVPADALVGRIAGLCDSVETRLRESGFAHVVVRAAALAPNDLLHSAPPPAGAGRHLAEAI